MEDFLKQLLHNITKDSLVEDIGNEEAFREILNWDEQKEIQLEDSISALILHKLSQDSLLKYETINQLTNLIKRLSNV